MTDNDNIDTIVSTLQKKVDTIVNKDKSSSIRNIIQINTKKSDFNMKPYIYYISISVIFIIIVIIILYIIKPKIIMYKDTDDNYRVNTKKLFILVFVLFVFMISGIIGWKYYKNKLN